MILPVGTLILHLDSLGCQSFNDMTRHAYIFVERNMGQDYAYAAPSLGFFEGWLWRQYIYPEVKQNLENRVQHLKDSLSAKPERFEEMLAEGISVYSYRFWHTVYSVRIAPDLLCPDPRAKGRFPYFIMHLLMPGSPEVISRRFCEFRTRCQKIAWDTMQAGIRDELKIAMPDSLYL